MKIFTMDMYSSKSNLVYIYFDQLRKTCSMTYTVIFPIKIGKHDYQGGFFNRFLNVMSPYNSSDQILSHLSWTSIFLKRNEIRYA